MKKNIMKKYSSEVFHINFVVQMFPKNIFHFFISGSEYLCIPFQSFEEVLGLRGILQNLWSSRTEYTQHQINKMSNHVQKSKYSALKYEQ